MINRANHSDGERGRTPPGKTRLPRTPFIFGAIPNRKGSQAKKTESIAVGGDGTVAGTAEAKDPEENTIAGGLVGSMNMTELIKTLIEMAREQGHLTYDDINEVLPDGASADDLDTLYTRLQSVGIEVINQAEVEKAKPEEPEIQEERSFDSLDDPVRMYMNQIGKVPLITREQEVEVCKRI